MGAAWGLGGVTSRGLFGTQGGTAIVGLLPVALGGQKFGAFGGELFEKIIVTPRLLDVGFVLSDQVHPVEVWNSHLAEAKALTGIVITGPGQLTLVGSSAMTYWPGQSQAYTSLLPQEGDLLITALATWSFTGEVGADMAVVGSRIMVFPHRPDWSEPYRESPGWLTEVLPGYDGSEQRRSLRTAPRYSLTYRVLTTEPLETASLEALIYGWQDRQYGVPVWPESTPLLGGLVPGATTLSADILNRPSFAAGGMVMIWSDFMTWEAFQVAAVSAGSITLGSQITRTWAAGARVVPLRRGRIQADQALGGPANWLSSGTFAFTCEAV